MYCVKCGQPAYDGNEYCANCGAKLQEPLIITDEEEPNREVVPSKNASANRLKLMLLIGAGAVVLAALILIVFNFSTVLNWFIRSASSPEDLLLTAYKNSLSETFSPIMENYEKVIATGKKANFKRQAEITLKPGKRILNAIGTGQSDISWLSDIRLHVNYAIRDSLQENVLAVGLGEQGILSLELITDSANRKMYLTVPELNQQSLMTDMGQNSGVANPDMAKLYEAMPSRQVLEQLAVRYMDIILGGFSHVDKRSETLILGDISQKVTVLEAYIDHADLLEVCAAVLEQVKSDEDIKQIAEGLNPWYNNLMQQSMTIYNSSFDTDYEAVDLYAELIAAVDKALEQLQDEFQNADPSNHLYLYTYLDDSNRIIGTNLVISGMEEPISNLTLSGDGRYFTQILIGSLQIYGGGPISDTFCGSFAVSVEGEKLFDMEAENVSKSKGTVYLEPSAAMLEAIADEMGLDGAMASMADVMLCIQFEESDSDSQCAISILSNDEPIMELDVFGKTTDAAEILLPENTVEFGDEETLYNWLTGCDLQGVFSNLSDAGVPEELLTALLPDTAEG